MWNPFSSGHDAQTYLKVLCFILQGFSSVGAVIDVRCGIDICCLFMAHVKVRKDAMGKCVEWGTRKHTRRLGGKQYGPNCSRFTDLHHCEQISSTSGSSAPSLCGGYATSLGLHWPPAHYLLRRVR